jgi:hypothetical protein
MRRQNKSAAESNWPTDLDIIQFWILLFQLAETNILTETLNPQTLSAETKINHLQKVISIHITRL